MENRRKNLIEMSIHARQAEKMYRLYRYLYLDCLLGYSDNTIMMVYPDAPFHYETANDIVIVIDGNREVHEYQKKVYDYPIKTVREWVEIYQKQGCFVKPKEAKE